MIYARLYKDVIVTTTYFMRLLERKVCAFKHSFNIYGAVMEASLLRWAKSTLDDMANHYVHQFVGQ